jgi:hypothetical protein
MMASHLAKVSKRLAWAVQVLEVQVLAVAQVVAQAQAVVLAVAQQTESPLPF